MSFEIEVFIKTDIYDNINCSLFRQYSTVEYQKKISSLLSISINYISEMKGFHMHWTTHLYRGAKIKKLNILGQCE